MSDPFKPVDRDTPYLLPPSLQDWLPRSIWHALWWRLWTGSI